MDNLILSEAFLKSLSEDGKIDLATIAAKIQTMADRQSILETHTCKIWLASDGYWKTKVRERDGKYRLIKKKSKSDLEDAVIEHIKGLSRKGTFKDRFDIWVDRQRNCGRSNNTINKYEADYKRFYAGYPFEQLDITEIDDEILSKHIIQVLKDKQLRWRAFKDIMGYTDGVFNKAIKDKMIPENPMKYIDLPIYRKYCYIPPVKTTKERTLTDTDTSILFQRIREPRSHNINKMCCFAIEMALYTGMRVGELAGLMWQDIIPEDGVIVIRHSEKYDRASRTFAISTTKTGRERVFPLIDEIKDLLERVKAYETEQGIVGEYVFMEPEGRLPNRKISETMRNITMSDDFTGIKSIHAIRRTVNSRLRYSGVSVMMASSLLGHTELVNNQNYTYDLTNLQQKKVAIEGIVTTSNQKQNIRNAEN